MEEGVALDEFCGSKFWVRLIWRRRLFMWWIFLQGNLCGVTLMEVGGRSQSFARLCVTGINNDIRVFLKYLLNS